MTYLCSKIFMVYDLYYKLVKHMSVVTVGVMESIAIENEMQKMRNIVE